MVTSGAAPTSSPAPVETVTYAPATRMRGPITVPVVDRVPQRHIDEGAVGADVAHGGEAGEQRRPRVPDAR